jgi:hypothetical protein
VCAPRKGGGLDKWAASGLAIGAYLAQRSAA